VVVLLPLRPESLCVIVCARNKKLVERCEAVLIPNR
jgi:hypothetical protein